MNSPLTERQRAQIIKSPLSIGAYIMPLKYGAGEDDYEFRADPFLLDIERNVMDAIADRKHRRFQAYNAPSQVTKSTTLEILTSLWTLTFWPNTRIIIVGYSDDLAIRSGSLIRDLIDDYGDVFGLAIDPRYDTKQEWRLAGHMGSVLSVGIGSRITGMPGDLIIIGDVIKNMEEAASQTTLDKIWEEYEGSIRMRMQKGGSILLGATRFSDQDPTGRLKTKMAEPDYKGDRWEFFSYKGIAEPEIDEEVADLSTWSDKLGRRFGEPLASRHSDPEIDEKNPEHWDEHHFYALKYTLSPFNFSCLVQQEPTSPTGGMFPADRWGWYDMDNVPRMVDKWRCWDLAASKGAGDWTVGGKVGKDEAEQVYILDIQRFREDPDQVLAKVKTVAAGDGVATPILIEEGRNGDGKTVISFYEKALRPYRVEAANADGSKETRAKPHSVIQQQGRSLLPRRLVGRDEDGNPIWQSPDWVPGFFYEHLKMMGDGRKGRHDDQIDVCAHAVNKMIDSAMVEMLIPGVGMHASGQVVNVDDDYDDDDGDQEVSEMSFPGVMV
jgi:phage terminase large subunit-like protein